MDSILSFLPFFFLWFMTELGCHDFDGAVFGQRRISFPHPEFFPRLYYEQFQCCTFADSTAREKVTEETLWLSDI